MNHKTILLVVLITGISFVAIGQKDYALTPKGDTLLGKLKMSSVDNLDRLQVINNGKKTNYTALQIKRFEKEGVVYESVKYDKTYRFMKVIKSGYLSLYAFNSAGQNIWDGRYLLKKDGSGIDVPNLAFKKFLTKYLEDCDDIRNKIDKGELTKRNMEQIVDTYNTCIETNTQVAEKTREIILSKNEKTEAIKKFSDQVEAENFLTKKDVVDLLKDIQIKVSKNEALPNYLIEGLRSYVADTPALSKSAEELITVLKKQ